jgi:hypothetical protein
VQLKYDYRSAVDTLNINSDDSKFAVYQEDEQGLLVGNNLSGKASNMVIRDFKALYSNSADYLCSRISKFFDVSIEEVQGSLKAL